MVVMEDISDGERETLETKGRGGSEHFVLGIAQLSLIRVRGAC